MSSPRRLPPFIESLAIPNLTLYLIVGQVAALGAMLVGQVSLEPFQLVPALVLQGEWWRIFCFLLMPPTAWHPLFLVFVWYLLYLMGSALEQQWGIGRYNLFIFVGWLLTVVVSFLAPGYLVTNEFIYGSVFLAFARLAPDFELRLYFLLPVKIKWLALLMWFYFAYECVFGTWQVRLGVFASVGNYLLFFAGDIWRSFGQKKRRRAHEAERVATRRELEREPHHRCHVCGKNSDTHPELDFRYCSKCDGDFCYCPEHLRNHEHVVAASKPAE